MGSSGARGARDAKRAVPAILVSLALAACSATQDRTSPPSATTSAAGSVTAALATSTAAPSADPATLAALPPLQQITAGNAGGIRLLRTLAIPGFEKAGASQCGVAFSHDGTLLSGACYQRQLPVWDVRSGGLCYSIDSAAPLVAVAFSPDDRTLAAGGLSDGIGLYDSGTGRLVKTLGKVADPTWDLAFSPKGDMLASAHKGRGSSSGSANETNMNLWDVSAGGLLWGSQGDGSASLVLSVSYAPDGKSVAFGDQDKALLVDAATGKLQRTLPVQSHVGGLAFSPAGTGLATASDDHDIRLWQTAGGKVQAVLKGHSGYVNGVVFSPDGHLVVSGSHDKTVGVWDAEGGRLLASLNGHEAAVLRVAVNLAGTLIASISWDGTVRLWGVAR